MTRGRVICEAVHVWALGLWLGALGLAVAAAAIVFPALKELDPRLPAFAAYDGPHWVLAGGRIAARVFAVLDGVQIGCAVLAGATLALAVARLGLSMQRGSTFVRAALLLALIGVLSYRLGLLEPRMQGALKAYWAAAAKGENAEAARHRAAFDAGHPVETRLMAVTAVLVLAAGGAALSSMRRSGAPAGGAAPLPEPALARGRR